MSEEPIEIEIESIHDFSNVCRTCAAVSEFVIPIFEGEGLQNNLADKISKHLPIRVCENDVLPRVVCYQCASTLLAWHEMATCCVQADAALRSRMPLPDAGQASIAAQEGNRQITTKSLQEKFKDITSFRAPLREPPKYTETSTRPTIPEPTKTCQFCKSEVAERVYEDHLVGAHAQLVFVCGECYHYIDRKLLLVHMSNHDIQYTNAARNATKPPEKIVKTSKNVDLNQNTKPPPKYPVPALQPRIAPKEEKELPNELLDQSDMDVESVPVTQSESSEDSQLQAVETKPVDGKLKKEKADTKGETKAKWSRSCPICFKRYTASSSFFYHMKHSHTTILEHECDVCGKKFASKANLVQHGAVHSDEYKYPCKSCDKRFKSRASLYIHVQTHGCATQAARHTCDTCGRGFRWRAALARHVTRHAGARTHACGRCERSFVARGDMLRHARTHAPTPLACSHCGLQFAQQRYLNVHLANKHSDKQNTKNTK